MMHLIEFMKTPMAAPETAALRSMRLTIIGCCAVLLPLMLVFNLARPVVGTGAIGVIAGLVAVLCVLAPVYIITKNRADDAYRDTMITQRDAE